MSMSQFVLEHTEQALLSVLKNVKYIMKVIVTDVVYCVYVTCYPIIRCLFDHVCIVLYKDKILTQQYSLFLWISPARSFHRN